MRYRSYILLTVFLLALAPYAGANTATYTFTGTATGTLGLAPFVAAAFTLTAAADTAAITPQAFPYTYGVPATSAAFDIAGTGTGAFAEASQVRISATNWADILVGGRDFDIQNDLLAGYNLSTSIGPLPATFADWGVWLLVPSSSGTLTFSTILSGGAFRAQVEIPEPSAVTLAGIGVVLLALGARRSRAFIPRHGRAKVAAPRPRA